MLDGVDPEPGAFYVMDRAYVDFGNAGIDVSAYRSSRSSSSDMQGQTSRNCSGATRILSSSPV